MIGPQDAKDWYNIILITGGGWVVAAALGGFCLMKLKWEREDTKAKIEQDKESEKVWAALLDKVLTYIENNTKVISQTGEAVSNISKTQEQLQQTMQRVYEKVCEK